MSMTSDSAVLIINAGSSSVKFSVYRLVDGALKATINGQIQGIGSAPRFDAKDAAKKLIGEKSWDDPKTNRNTLLSFLLDWLKEQLHGAKLLAAGHRVLHGGTKFSHPVLLTPGIVDELEALVPLGPLHQPHNVAGIRALMETHPELPQVAIFDTAFHCATNPWLSYAFAIPRNLTDEGVRRYGFHGTSYEYIASQLPRVDAAMAKGCVVVAHLGSGASLAAIRDGKGIDTTMGLTPLDGLVMGTRCGHIDPSVLLYLMRNKGMSVDQIETLLNKESGLLAVSGVSNDMRPLLESDDPHAKEAVDMFCHSVARHTMSMAASMQGFDGLVFTAGIGEHSAPVRAMICENLAWAGIKLDPAANAKNALKISAPDSRIPVYVVPTDEEGMIVQHTLRVLDEAKAEA
jgi:acetate kinase